MAQAQSLHIYQRKRVMHSFPSKANLDQSKNQFIIQVENDGGKKGTCEPRGWPRPCKTAMACKSAATGHIVFMSTWFSLSYKKWDSSHHTVPTSKHLLDLEDFFLKINARYLKKEARHHKSLHFFTVLWYIYWQTHIVQHQCLVGKSAAHSSSFLSGFGIMCKCFGCISQLETRPLIGWLAGQPIRGLVSKWLMLPKHLHMIWP